jgi:ribosomal protein S18 acetylase RimI-like enzyme
VLFISLDFYAAKGILLILQRRRFHEPWHPQCYREADDIPGVVKLQHRVFSGMNPWKPELLARHIAIFPEGQLVAADESGQVLGSASSLIIDWDDYAESANWSAITSGETFETHNPLGKTLYGADIGVDPLARRQGIGPSCTRPAEDCP